MLAPKAGLLLAILLLTACQQVAQEPKAAPQRDPRKEALALVQGLGGLNKPCQNDSECAVGPSVGACVLGTCFGLLTTDNRAARRVLVQRLSDADAAVQQQAQTLLLGALAADPGQALPGLSTAAIEGLGAILRKDPQQVQTCGPVCLALRAQAASADPRVAATARLVLVRAGDTTLLAEVLVDLREGTELLRVEAAGALTAHLSGPHAGEVEAALVERLTDRSPVVQVAVVQALSPVASRPAVRDALQALVAERAPHLAYAVDRALAGK